MTTPGATPDPSEPQGSPGPPEPGWQPPGPPPPPPPSGIPGPDPAGPLPPGQPVVTDSYGTGNVILWALVTMIAMVPFMTLGQMAALALGGWISSVVSPSGGGAVSSVALLSGLLLGLVPVVVALLRMRSARSKHQAGTWLGVLIGSSLFLLVFGGACVALVVGTGGM